MKNLAEVAPYHIVVCHDDAQNVAQFDAIDLAIVGNLNQDVETMTNSFFKFFSTKSEKILYGDFGSKNGRYPTKGRPLGPGGNFALDFWNHRITSTPKRQEKRIRVHIVTKSCSEVLKMFFN